MHCGGARLERSGLDIENCKFRPLVAQLLVLLFVATATAAAVAAANRAAALSVVSAEQRRQCG